MRVSPFLPALLPLLLLLPLSRPAGAAEISHTCSVSQGFDFEPDSQAVVGHLVSLKIGDTEFASDLSVTDPESPGGDSSAVFGVVTEIQWEGLPSDPISIAARVSTANKNALMALLHTTLADKSVEFVFTIFDYDPGENTYYRAFSSDLRILNGLIQNEGGQLSISVDSDPAIDVVEPPNFPFSITITPPVDVAQALDVAISATDRIQRQWGPDPPPTVLSIARLNPPTRETTTRTSAVYRVTFSENVHGVASGDFTLVDVAGTIAGERITSVSATSGSVIDVTVNTGTSGNGDLRLDVLLPRATITDDAGSNLETSFTAGPVFTVADLILKVGPLAADTLSLTVDNLPAGRDFHLRESVDGIDFTPLDPPIDFTKTTPQPFVLPVDRSSSPLLLYQVYEGTTP